MQVFDLTKEIKLTPELHKKYTAARVTIHVLFMLLMLFVAYRILFPIIPLDFDMNTPNSTKNTLVSARDSQTGIFPAKGIISANNSLLFNANPLGEFSNAAITITTSKKTLNIENTPIKIQKSYQAFFYPTGEQVGFSNGALLSTSADASYYIVSNGLLRKFANPNVIMQLGYPKSAFMEVSPESLKLNKPGEQITDTASYPDGTLFAIDGNYYQLQNQQLSQFVSINAFLSQFDAASAIVKDQNFLAKYQVAEKFLGFIDGTLASNADSVFILSEGKSYPVVNAIVFQVMGYNWNDIVPISSDELGAYQKQKQFNDDAPHPNGTIFIDQKNNQHFIIKDGKKLPINNPDVLKTYADRKAIIANSTDSAKELTCSLKKDFLSSNNFSCEIPLTTFNELIGNDYQLSAKFPIDTNLSALNVTFSTPLTTNSLMNSLSVIKNKLQNKGQ